MDGSEWTPTEEDGAVGGDNTRQRNDSDSSEDGSVQGKRQRSTNNAEFGFPGVNPSPPAFVSLEELMKASHGLENMALAHEIAVEKDFKLEKIEPPEHSLAKRVKETFHKAFWDLLAEQLAENPPVYSHALVLLTEIKQILLSLLLPQHTKLKEEISENLDTELIKQQTEAGVLDFERYAQYVISVMGKLCAPVRDERIKELTETREVISVFRGIMETLHLMKLDMANFTIELIRPNIIAQSVEYEKQKFADYLKVTPGDGLEFTRKWLLKHLPEPLHPVNGHHTSTSNLTDKVLADAYLELLEWNPENNFPETLALDKHRFIELGNRTYRLTLTVTILLISLSCVQNLQGLQCFKDRLKKNMKVLLEDIHNDKELEKSVPSIIIQVIQDVKETLKENNMNDLLSSGENLLTAQITEVAVSSHKIRQLVRQRVREFLRQTITSPTAARLQIPAGLSSHQAELTEISGRFLRLVSHNRAVFGERYLDVVSAAVNS